MHKPAVKYLLGIVFIIAGLLIIGNSEDGITGAVLGTWQLSSTFNAFIGFTFVLIGITFFALSSLKEK
jgi:hypothetical protein